VRTHRNHTAVEAPIVKNKAAPAVDEEEVEKNATTKDQDNNRKSDLVAHLMLLDNFSSTRFMGIE
jgi:hypothetical protein